MFTYLVLPFGSAPFLCEKMLILCTSYALRNGLFVLFRTVLYIDVHRGLGHGLGQNVTSKIWLNFLLQNARKNSEIKRFRSFLWWTVQDSNLWPHARQACAHTSWANCPTRFAGVIIGARGQFVKHYFHFPQKKQKVPSAWKKHKKALDKSLSRRYDMPNLPNR